MIEIQKAGKEDYELVSELGRLTFLQSHGHSANPADIEKYISNNFSPSSMLEDLSDAGNLYHLIWYHGQPAGYSKMILNKPHENIPEAEVTKLERIYLLDQFLNLKLGEKLLQFNIGLSKKKDQKGMWLFVWVENKRAFRFYKNAGFNIVGNFDFVLTENHSNPNHQMLLWY